MPRFLQISCLIAASAIAPAGAQQPAATPPPADPAAAARPARPQVPARDPHTPGYVEAKELPDGQVPPKDQDGNFIVGPTHPAAPETVAQEGVPKGKVIE